MSVPAVKRWRDARDLADLGTLTAEWLMGDLAYLPGYRGGGPDPETDELTSDLVVLNLHRFISIGSQPGCDEVHDGVRWRQRAAVELLGWDDGLADRVIVAARSAGLRVIDNGPARRWRTDHSTSLVVTTRHGRPHTDFGSHLSRTALSRFIFPGVGRQAVRAACDARQITIVDACWGRRRLLWSTLRSALGCP
jgi:hypothetical protein